MAVLTGADRKSMSQNQFALPGRRFPLNDASHQRAAIRDAPISMHAGNISAGQEKAIVGKAKAKLKGGRISAIFRPK